MGSNQTATIRAFVSAYDSGTPGVVPIWGLAIFKDGVFFQGVKAIPTGTHAIQLLDAGPDTAHSYTLVTTALTGTTSIVGKSIVVEVFPV